MPRSTRFAPIDVVRFVLARLDDEEAGIRRSARSLRGHDDRAQTASLEHRRADCLARRQVTGAVQQLLVLRDLPQEKPVRDHATQILLSLASPYSGHKAFRTEWLAQAS
ncbi:DUF6221 family protein [uncultured Jatrophihabitans sp.]|uniref:DUF6221 family protein n=1 Tax=uncultured Jatrophihabitans sp. TaxID=1610747 RepID=UPI0035CB9AB6